MRGRIAGIMLGARQDCARLGQITLKPHQQSAVARIEAAFEEFGGVLLADDVGMGKTFVATAIARSFSRTLVVAPAALGPMWRDALMTTGTIADLVTFERLSGGKEVAALHTAHDLVVVDEAHHARNPATRRYRILAELVRGARVLLLTATPIHNRRSEIVALLALFLGSRARALTEAELARCLVRRERKALPPAVTVPTIKQALHREVSDNPAIVQELMSLPPPLPVRDGGLAGALTGRGLVHQWASSEAALCEALRRRIAKAAALTAALESGNYPTARELETWTYGEGALQLGFPEILSSPTDNAKALLDAVRSHGTALEDFRERHRADSNLDVERAEILVEIRAAHPNEKIVAFTQYAETASMLFSRVVGTGRVAALTARGGFVAGGKLTRDEVLARFAPRALRAEPPPRAEQIDLLLTTDLLSEGVNLQDAGVAVHLDVPWTAARMEQRVGRVARMGSRNPLVYVYVFRPPKSAEVVLRSERLVQRKWSAAKRAVGSGADAPFDQQVETDGESPVRDSVPTRSERLRGILERWRHNSCLPRQSPDIHVASVHASHSGFLAALSVGDMPVLLTSIGGEVSGDVECQITVCALCEGREVETRREDYVAAIDQVHAWLEHDLASASAGVAGSRSLVRSRLLSRIDAAIQNASPHIRMARSRIASRARDVVTSQHGAAFESNLALLAHSPLPDHQWLEAVAGLDSTRPAKQVAHHAGTPTIRALLLMRDTA